MRKNVLIIFALMVLSACGGRQTQAESAGAAVADSTPEPVIIHDAVTDMDGNSYDAVQIGNQVWMAENLRTKTIKTKEGEIVHLQTGGIGFNMWGGSGSAYCYPDGQPENEEQYGLLYSEYFVFTDKTPCIICPEGWHYHTKREDYAFKTLRKFIDDCHNGKMQNGWSDFERLEK